MDLEIDRLRCVSTTFFTLVDTVSSRDDDADGLPAAFRDCGDKLGLPFLSGLELRCQSGEGFFSETSVELSEIGSSSVSATSGSEA